MCFTFSLRCDVFLFFYPQAPNNVVTYTLSGNAKALEYFQVGSSSGQVSVLQPLYLDTDRTITYTVRDQCHPAIL